MGKFLTYSATDIGTVREKNQDCIGIIVNTHPMLNAALGVICDGVGGLKEGEYASFTTYNRFIDWFQYELPQLAEEEEFESILQKRWTKIVENHNQYLYQYAVSKEMKLGTTLTALLLFRGRYYTMQVGDSRAYEITQNLTQLTEDQSLVALEVRQGRLTKEQAKHEPRQNILLQSIGYSKHITPEFTSGNMIPDASYLICSDGFYHFIEEEEMINNYFVPSLENVMTMKERTDSLIECVKARGEKDNISVAVLKYVADQQEKESGYMAGGHAGSDLVGNQYNKVKDQDKCVTCEL